MTKKQGDKSYLANAKALSKLFPSLKKYARRKKLNRYEKAAIGRAVKIFEIVGHPDLQPTPLASRPEKYRDYTYPARRARSEESYREAAKKLEPHARGLREYRFAKKLTPGQKSHIAYLEKRVRHVKEHLEPLEQSERRHFKKLGKDIIFPVKGLTSIKLKNVAGPNDPEVIAYGRRTTPEGMIITADYKNGNRREYRFIYAGADEDKIRTAAAKLKDWGAQTLYIWTQHGRTAAGFSSVRRLMASLGDEDALREMQETNMEDIAYRAASGGFALVFGDEKGRAKRIIRAEKKRRRDMGATDKTLAAMSEGTWIFGVIGLKESKWK